MRHLIRACLLAASFTLPFAAPSSATPLANKMISNVVVEGTTYNISFFDAALSQVQSQFQFTFQTFSSASNAVVAIVNNAQFKALLTGANTIGDDTTYYQGILVPYGALLPGTNPAEYKGAKFHADTGQIEDLRFYYAPSNSPFTTGNYTFVGYPVTVTSTPGQTPADLAVPEPASIALVALALFGACVIRRRV